MKKRKEFIQGLLVCVVELVIGVLLLLNPSGFTSGIIKALGAALAVTGLLKVFQYFKKEPIEAALDHTLTKGLCCLLAGAFCVFGTQWFVSLFPVLSTLYGAVILLLGITKVQLAIDMLRMKHPRWMLAGCNALMSILCAVVILLNPFATVAVMWIFVGIVLIVEAVLDILTMILRERSPYDD